MNERGSGRDYTTNGGAIAGGNCATNEDAIGGGGAKVGDLVTELGGVGVPEPAAAGAFAHNYVINEVGAVDDDCVAGGGDGVDAGGTGGDVGGVEVLEAAAAAARTISPDLPCLFNNYAIDEGAVVVVVGGGDGDGGGDDYKDDDNAIINVGGVGDGDDNAFNNAGDHIGHGNGRVQVVEAAALDALARLLRILSNDSILDAGNINGDDGGLEVLEDVAAADEPAARNKTKLLRMLAFEGTTAISLSLSGAVKPPKNLASHKLLPAAYYLALLVLFIFGVGLVALCVWVSGERARGAALAKAVMWATLMPLLVVLSLRAFGMN